MISTFKEQMDYLFFLYGLAFIMLAAVCFILRKQEGQRLPWIWLGLYGFMHGVDEWLDILTYSLGDMSFLSAACICATIIYFVCLLEFGRYGVIIVTGEGTGRWIYAPLLALTALGSMGGWDGLQYTSRLVLGLTGGLWAALALFLESKNHDLGTRRWLQAGSLAMGFYALTLVVPDAPVNFTALFSPSLFHETFRLTFRMARGIFVFWIVLAIWFYSQISCHPHNNWYYFRNRSKYAAWLAVSLVIILGAGWASTEFWGNLAESELRETSKVHEAALTNHLVGMLHETEHAVIAMAGSPWIIPVLSSGEFWDIERANSVLDRYKEASGASVCYLLDSTGKTVVSSNRNDKDSFVGNSYAFRPYFQQAVSGQAGRYFALGITSGERGYYASFPVRDEQGRIIGVAVIKRAINAVEDDFQQYPCAFLIDANGIIFISSKRDMLFKSLWPLDEEVKKKALSSIQFGAGSIESVFSAEVFDGESLFANGGYFLLTRQPVNQEGWSIVVLSSKHPIIIYRLFNIFITLILCILAVAFYLAFQLTKESGAKIEASEKRLRSIFMNAPEAIFILNANTRRILSANPIMARWLGYSQEELLKLTLNDLLEPGTQDIQENIDAILNNGTTFVGERSYQKKDGTLLDVEITGTNLSFRKKDYIIAFLRDITERKQAAEILKRYQLLSEHARDIILFIRVNGQIIDANKAAVSAYGYGREELISMSIYDLRDSTTESIIASQIEQANSNGILFETVHHRKDGSTFPVEVSSQGMKIGGERVLLSVIRDITKRKQMEEKIKHQAFHDNLTGLPNRILFNDRLNLALSHCRRNREMLGVLFLDLDQFKLINDTMGHAIGDQLLQGVAERLRSCVRENDTVARLGGDEFVLMLSQIRKEEHAVKVAQKIIGALQKPWLIGGKQFCITTSIGIGIYPINGEDAETLIQNADVAMYRAKVGGRNNYKLFTETT